MAELHFGEGVLVATGLDKPVLETGPRGQETVDFVEQVESELEGQAGLEGVEVVVGQQEHFLLVEQNLGHRLQSGLQADLLLLQTAQVGDDHLFGQDLLMTALVHQVDQTVLEQGVDFVGTLHEPA